MFNIRPAILGDIPQITALYAALSVDNAPIDFLKKVIDCQQSALLIAENNRPQDVDNKAPYLGMIILQQQITPVGTYLPPLNFCYMIDLVIPPHIDKIKITKALINAGKSWANSIGIEYLEIGV